MTLLVRGIEWSDPAAPRIRLVDDTTGDTTFLTHTSVFRFSVDERRGRRCLGWRDMTADGPGYLPCDRDAKVTSGRQCDRCRHREGFTSVHQAHVNGAHIHPNVRTYLTQPQWLYIDIFAGGRTKVGTASQFRKYARVAEQGAAAAMYVAGSTDGYNIRILEAEVSRQFHLSQAIRTSRKIEALTNRIDTAALCNELQQFVVSNREELSYIGSGIEGIEIFEQPEVWTPPACSQTVFDASPALMYPHSFESGEHSLHLEGLTGPVALFRTDTDPESPRFVADISALVGRTVTVGNFDSPGVAIQESLF